MATYIPIISLKVKRPYKIERTCERDGNILLHLRGYEEDRQEFINFLLSRSYHQEFRRVKRLNEEKNGETAAMKLKYYGSCCSGSPVSRISGRGFITYLR